MNKFHASKFIILAFVILLCCQFCTTSKEKEIVIRVKYDKLRPAQIEYEQKGDKKIEKLIFEYDPREDINRSLKETGFRLVRKNNQKYDLTLVIKYFESYTKYPDREKSLRTRFEYELQDEGGKIILKNRHNGGTYIRRFIVSNKLSEMIKGRLEAPDEFSFLISQIKPEQSLERPLSSAILQRNMSHLRRLFELKDPRSIKVFVPFLRSYDPYIRWIAKFALLELDYWPTKGTKDELAFEMINANDVHKTSVEYNVLESGPELSNKHKNYIKRRYITDMIITYGAPAIEMIIEDKKCQHIMKWHMWYGGGQNIEDNPRIFLKYLTERKWWMYLYERRRLRKRAPFSLEWKQEWNEAAVSKLIEVVSAEHEELVDIEKMRFYDFAIEVLGEIADKRAIEPLKSYLAAHPESTTVKKAIEKIEIREKTPTEKSRYIR